MWMPTPTQDPSPPAAALTDTAVLPAPGAPTPV